jgi:tRNA-Thr(GGU) m(6)t(6)A37 methyltransferase TsaA
MARDKHGEERGCEPTSGSGGSRPRAGAHIRERRRATQERARATVQAILQAAAELICDLGYHAASTNKIAARAGVSIGSLYQYFANKEAILARLQDEHHLEVHAVVEHALPVLTDPSVPIASGLHRLFTDLVALHERDPKLTRTLSSEVPHPQTTQTYERDYVTYMEELLRRRPDVSVADLGSAAAIVVMVTELLTHWLAHDAPPELDRRRILDEMVAMLGSYLSGGRDPAEIACTPIGIVHTPFDTTEGMPIQPSRASGIEGTVEVFPEYAGGLADLDGFSHIILLCHFHRARPYRLRVVPFLDDQERGLFATRSPSRPNPIGLSVVRLLGIEGARLTVADVDILDGTPLLDIKPWVDDFDQRRDVRCGWLDEARRRQARSDDRFEARQR